jgi:hypothetical protein
MVLGKLLQQCYERLPDGPLRARQIVSSGLARTYDEQLPPAAVAEEILAEIFDGQRPGPACGQSHQQTSVFSVIPRGLQMAENRMSKLANFDTLF